MALVRNNMGHSIALSVGTLDPFEQRNIDVSGANEIDLLAQGVIVLVDGSMNPPAPAEPFAQRPREVFYSSTQPPNMKPGQVWRRTDPTTKQVVEELEMT